MWTKILRAITRPSWVCPHCGGSRVHASGHVYGPLVALFGLRAYRCEECRRRFPVRAWRGDLGAEPGDAPEFWPPQHWPPEDWVRNPAGVPGPADRVAFASEGWTMSDRRFGDRRSASWSWHGPERRRAERRRAPAATDL